MRRNRKDEPEYIRKARKKVRAKKWFYRHFSVYGVIILFLFFMNMLEGGMNDPWFLYPALAWGVFIAIHYLFVFGLPGSNAGTKEWEERELARELAKMAPEETVVALPPERTESPEFNLDEHLELREVDKQKTKNPVYRTDDLV